ncbi:MAG: pyruvate kinase [Nitrospirota bacterium]
MIYKSQPTATNGSCHSRGPRRSKIVCTLGPATESEEKIAGLIDAGVDLIRINFSHGSQEEHGKAIDKIRLLSERKKKPVAILQDLQGSKIRIGPLKKPHYQLNEGGSFTLFSSPRVGDENGVSTSHTTLYKRVAPGDSILLNDGQIALSVDQVLGKDILCKIKEGGILAPYKGVNVPGKALGVPTLTRKDWDDLKFGLDRGVDFVALSMVRDANDIVSIKRFIKKAGKTTAVIAKLELAVAISNLDKIIQVSDGVMVARGDLGVDLPPEHVPLLQKEIIRKANLAQIPVITATQMLESMVTQWRPTRAEVSDVANAVLDGTDALMLSAETATGAYPIETVRMMNRIIVAAESSLPASDPTLTTGLSVSEAVSKAACLIAHEMNATAIVTSTLSGGAALRLSKYRPQVPIIACTPDVLIQRRMSLYWGVATCLTSSRNTNEDMFAEMIAKVRQGNFAKKGDLLVLVSQSPKIDTAPTDLIKVYQVS